jgi:hypothetical protein
MKKMGIWHIDPDCEKAIINLNDTLCSFERATGREYTVIIVPHAKDEKILMSQNGKPLPPDSDMTPGVMLAMAMRARQRQ